MKYKVVMKVSYCTAEFLFGERMDALDFMDMAAEHHEKSKEDSFSIYMVPIKEA